MRLRDLAPCLPIALLVVAPLACSSSTTSDTGTTDTDAGDQSGDDGGPGGDDGGTTADTGSGPFTPGAHPSYPQVPNNSGGGGLITNMKLYVIIPSNETTAGLSGFGAAFMASNTWKGVASEYGLGTARTPVTIAGAALSGPQSEGAIQNYIESNIGAGQQPDGSSMYLVFLGSAAYIEGDQGCQTQGIGGYHVPFNGGGDGWGVIQHCTGLPPGTTDAQWATIAGSHEIAEAATDVDGQSGYAFQQPNATDPTQTSIWDDVLLTEIGDLCVQTQITEGSYTYQRMWSNKAAKSAADPCAPAITPYFSAGPTGGDANGWFQTKNNSVVIPIEGFSTAAMDPWPLVVQVGRTSGNSGWSGTLTTKEKTSGQSFIANGEKGTLTISAPAGAQSGDWAEIELASVSPTATGGEYAHIWPIGVYVP